VTQNSNAALQSEDST